MRRQHSHRPLRAPHQPPAFTYQTRDALAAILEADVGVILSEDLYSDGIGLERLLAELGGTRRTAIGIIAELIKKTTADGAAPGSIGSWSYFTRPAKIRDAEVAGGLAPHLPRPLRLLSPIATTCVVHADDRLTHLNTEFVPSPSLTPPAKL